MGVSVYECVSVLKSISSNHVLKPDGCTLLFPDLVQDLRCRQEDTGLWGHGTGCGYTGNREAAESGRKMGS